MNPVSIAPMMDRTDRHFRYFMRKVAPHTLMYTEMVTTGAILNGDKSRLLDFDPSEHPIALQLGGDNADDLAASAKIAQQWGYDEVNLNVGCPSDRVQKGRFGACLMATPEVVANAVIAMRSACDLEVTVKHRIGIDDLDTYEHMLHFVDTVAAAGCKRFSVHARKAWLKGLSPKQNRNVPPLRYDDVYRLKRERPQLDIEINGGITTVEAVQGHLERVDGVMIGRAAVDTPYLMAQVDQAVFGGSLPSRLELAESMIPYLDALGEADEPAHRVTRHMLQLFASQPGARRWKRELTERGRERGSSSLRAAIDVMHAGARGAA